jgi:hypothetical protein
VNASALAVGGVMVGSETATLVGIEPFELSADSPSDRPPEETPAGILAEIGTRLDH